MADTTTTTVQPEPDTTTEVVQPRSRRRGIIIVVVAIIIVAAVAFWWHSTFSEDTDDAQVNGHLIQVSSRIAGQVQKVYVDENQQVKKGDPIVELDPRDFQVAVENAKAVLASAKANALAVERGGAADDHQHRERSHVSHIPTSAARTPQVLQAQQQQQAAHARVAAGAGQQRQGPGGPGAVQAAGGEGRDQQAAV